MMARLRSKAWLHSPRQNSNLSARMLVNFLHPFFQSRVDCDVVSSDGYSVGNLVSMDFRECSRGFLAAHFIKPPALLLFQLPFPIHVESMIIKPKVGSQISSGIAILVAGIATKRDSSRKGDISNNKSSQLSRKKRTKKELLSDSNKVGISQQGSALCCQNRLERETSIHIPNHSYELDITPGSAKGEHSQVFSQVAWLNDREGKTIHIQNKLFQQRSPVQGFNPIGRSDFQEGEFQRPYLLQKVTHVALKIVRLNGSSVPAIGKVEIWGQPSAACKPGVLEYTLGIQEKIQTGAAIRTTTAIRNKTSDDSKNHTLLCYSSSSIPEDFIDPITCELMTAPVLLPSGHNIDTTTLEKHITVERSWGRLPSDPFTGKVFSDTSKPVPNSALKVRIDKFLLTSGVSTSSFGRTVGRENSSSRASNVNDSLILKTNGNVPSGGSNKSVHCDRKEFSEQSDSNSRVDVSDQTGVELGHEEAVSRSLDSAVHQTLRGLHMFTRNMTGNKEVPTLTQASITQANTGLQGRLKRAAPQASETLRNQIKKKKSTVLCVTCDRDLSTESIFHLPCHHVMCRSCLMNATQEKNSDSTCKRCKTKFRQMDVTRVHNI